MPMLPVVRIDGPWTITDDLPIGADQGTGSEQDWHDTKDSAAPNRRRHW